MFQNPNFHLVELTEFNQSVCQKSFINMCQVVRITRDYNDLTVISFTDGGYALVKETPEEIAELVKPKPLTVVKPSPYEVTVENYNQGHERLIERRQARMLKEATVGNVLELIRDCTFGEHAFKKGERFAIIERANWPNSNQVTVCPVRDLDRTNAAKRPIETNLYSGPWSMSQDQTL